MSLTDHDEPTSFICHDDNRLRGDSEWETRHLAVLHSERQDPTNSGLWWLSFVDPAVAATVPEHLQKPGGPSFLGACWVEAEGFVHAVETAHLLGCNPGGEVRGWGPFPPTWASLTWKAAWTNRLLDGAAAAGCPDFDQRPAGTR